VRANDEKEEHLKEERGMDIEWYGINIMYAKDNTVDSEIDKT